MNITKEQIALAIEKGETLLGIELGSTRIKGVLILKSGEPVASGGYTWENRYENGIWTYSEADIKNGLGECFASLAADVKGRYGVELCTTGGVGISAMMHGYLPFDNKNRLLVPFRTWRNTITQEASQQLTKLLGFNIPQRWSVAHIYQAILNKEEHTKNIAYIQTLAGYVHMLLTGENVLGAGDASGMFPLAADKAEYNSEMAKKLDVELSRLGFAKRISDILPKPLQAGEYAGKLTKEGAALLDKSGRLRAGIPFCPPEGDAGTGMVATNSVLPKTGNISAGTSVFAMVVPDKPLRNVHSEIDIVATPDGKPVAMVHCNNCTSEINGWAELFCEVMTQMGCPPKDMGSLFDMLYNKAAEGKPDGGGLMAYNYLSGEPVTGFSQGVPMFMRSASAEFNLASFMRTQMYSAMATLAIGMEILKADGVSIERLNGHGGFFKAAESGQKIASAALGCPIAVTKTAGEGGAWGMALLASYMLCRTGGESLGDYLNKKIFSAVESSVVSPVKEDRDGFLKFLGLYKAGLAAEKAAVECYSSKGGGNNA